MNKVSGIYLITNTSNSKQYIGSAICVLRRKGEHLRTLRSNTHKNSKLQNAWNKYGEQSFIFEVIEEVLEFSLLIAREQYWIDTINPFYNINKVAGSSLGHKHSESTKLKISISKLGTVCSEETKLKLREARAKRIISNETRLALSKALSGRKFTKEHKDLLSIAKLGKKQSQEHIANRQEAIKRNREMREK